MNGIPWPRAASEDDPDHEDLTPTERRGAGTGREVAPSFTDGPVTDGEVERHRGVRDELRAHRVPASVAVVGTLALLTLGSVTGQANWSVYVVVMSLGAALVIALHLRVGFSGLTIWGLVLFGVGHVAGGMVPVGDGILYQWWVVDDIVRYDNLQHAWGFGFVGRAAWEVLRSRLVFVGANVAPVAFWTIVIAAAGIGAVNEVIEYGMTITLAETQIGGYDNTARDLAANLVGGVLVGLWTRRELRARPANAQRESVS